MITHDMPNPVKLYISHNANGDGWFVVAQLPSAEEDIAALVKAGRTVYEIEFTGKPWEGKLMPNPISEELAMMIATNPAGSSSFECPECGEEVDIREAAVL